MITYAYLETTNYCNLDCSYCNRKDVIGPLQHMPVETFVRVLDALDGHPITEVKLMGMGEPFLHPQFDEICRLFKERFPKAFLISATNCQYKIKETFKNSLKYIDMLYLSIDGYKERYERDRHPAKWSKLISFMKELEHVDRHDCKIVCNYVVNPNNVYDIKLVDEFIVNKYDLDELRLNIAQNWSEDESMIGGYTEDRLAYLKENYQNNIKGITPWTYSNCFWPESGVYITVEGDVKVCCMNTSANSFGNILRTPINEIRTSTKFLNVHDGCKQNKPTVHCKNCSYKELNAVLEKIL